MTPDDQSAGNQTILVSGGTKLMVGQALRELATAQPGGRIALLRHFNPVWAHESGQIGEDPRAVPNTLLPYVVR